MLRRKHILLIVAAIVVAASVVNASGGSITIASYNGRGHFIGGHITYGGCTGPVVRQPVIHAPGHHRNVSIRSPHRGRFVRILPRHRAVVAVRQPWEKQIVVDPIPNVRVVSPRVVAEHPTITVWITNSNGSRTAVNLKRSAPGYVGPRGEWYRTMPPEKQLRIIYGF
jgi:hypothetical protein